MIDPDWIVITPFGGRFKKSVRRSLVGGWGLMDATVGGGRSVRYVEMYGCAIVVEETQAQLAELLGAEIP